MRSAPGGRHRSASFPRRRESRPRAATRAMDSRFRRNDGQQNAYALSLYTRPLTRRRRAAKIASPKQSVGKGHMDERELREEEILRQAAKVFKEKGYHGASVQDIADAVGMQKGSLYYHIESKEDLLFRVMDRGMGTVLAPLEEVARLTESPVAKLRLAVENHVRLLTQNLDALT